jgi:hypothetical protein
MPQKMGSIRVPFSKPPVKGAHPKVASNLRRDDISDDSNSDSDSFGDRDRDDDDDDDDDDRERKGRAKGDRGRRGHGSDDDDIESRDHRGGGRGRGGPKRGGQPTTTSSGVSSGKKVPKLGSPDSGSTNSGGSNDSGGSRASASPSPGNAASSAGGGRVRHLASRSNSRTGKPTLRAPKAAAQQKHDRKRPLSREGEKAVAAEAAAIM